MRAPHDEYPVGFLAITHYLMVAALGVGACFAAIGAWIVILVRGAYPRSLFD